jgi:hypothetical protein
MVDHPFHLALLFFRTHNSEGLTRAQESETQTYVQKPRSAVPTIIRPASGILHIRRGSQFTVHFTLSTHVILQLQAIFPLWNRIFCNALQLGQSCSCSYHMILPHKVLNQTLLWDDLRVYLKASFVHPEESKGSGGCAGSRFDTSAQTGSLTDARNPEMISKPRISDDGPCGAKTVTTFSKAIPLDGQCTSLTGKKSDVQNR